jgi:hypothetical protein
VASKSPPSLPSFAGNWVGGDIHGLWAFAATLYRYVPQFADVVTALDKKVSQVVGSAGWQGSAASAFSTSWDRDATASRALGVALDEEGDIVGQLALNLATIEHALESAAQKVEQEGVPVGAGGQPPAARLADATKQQWAQAYQTFWEQCMQAARQARQQAASALDGLYAQIDPGTSGPNYDTLGQDNSLADYMRGLFALPTAYRRLVEAKIPGLRQGAAAAQVAARENARGPDGRFGPWSAEDRQAFAAQRTQLASVEQQTANAASHENLLTKALGSGAGDVMDGSADWGRAGKFLGDIPFASEGLAGVGVGLTIAGDRSQGESWGLSASDGITSNASALVAGEAAGDLGALGGTAALGALGVGATGAAIGGVVVAGAAGAVVAVGVGDLVHNAFQEHWGGDIHQYGVVGGIGHGAVDTLDKTGHDLGNMASGVWHGITSIF